MAFTWRGESSDSHGVVVKSLPPVYTPQLRDESVIIPGRSGALHLQDGAYEEQLMMIEGYLPYEQGVKVSPLETIKEWLTGTGDLTLSDRPQRKYRARIIDSIAFTPWVVGFADRMFSVSFWADPFAYEDPASQLLLYEPFTLVNPSAIPAEPVITVRGSGTVVLAVGDVSVTLENVSGSVTIDSEARLAYVSGASTPVAITLNDEVWPVLGPGGSRISWSGGVNQVVVQPNWRWL